MSNFFRAIFLPITIPLDFISKYFKPLVFIVILVLIFGDKKSQSLNNANLAKIYLKGIILDSTQVLKDIKSVAENTKYKGVMFIIDSPGGSVPPSIEISEAIKRLNTIKPVVVYAKGTLASGSYYSSIWANKIIANPGSMIGSIGVVLQSPDMSALMDKVGIKYRSIRAGKYKDIGNPLKVWKEYENIELQKVINGTYEMFIKDVAMARGLKIEDHTVYADAHIFTASQAKNVGLIDEVGVLYDASAVLQTLSGVDTPIYEEIKEDELKAFFKDITRESILEIVNFVSVRYMML